MRKGLIILVVLVLASVGYAQGRGQGSGGGCVFSQMGLTSKQQDKMIEIKKKHRDEVQELKKEISEARFEMMKVLEDDFDEAKANAFANKLAELGKRKLLTKISLIKSVKGILNEEQFKMMKMMRLWQSKGRGRGRGQSGRQGMMGRGQGRGMGQGQNANVGNQ